MQVLPALLRSLEEEKWRTKHAAVELLGSMAYCAPKQLAATLPQVVPALTEHALTASHPRVKEGANTALASVGAVIKNPEIARLVPTLLKALADPGNATPGALDALAHCQVRVRVGLGLGFGLGFGLGLGLGLRFGLG